MIEKIKVSLDTTYITKALDSDSLGQIISSNNPGIVHRIYLLTNGLKKRQDFLEISKNDKYNISATVSTNYAYAGDAKRQAEVITFMKDIVKRRHSFIIRYTITRKSDMKDVFSFKHETTNKKEVVDLINKLEQKTKELCKVDTY
jgi:hypothetical protein